MDLRCVIVVMLAVIALNISCRLVKPPSEQLPISVRAAAWIPKGLGAIFLYIAAVLPIGIVVDRLDPDKVFWGVLALAPTGALLIFLGDGLTKGRKWAYNLTIVGLACLALSSAYKGKGIGNKLSGSGIALVAIAALFSPTSRRFFSVATPLI